MLIGYDFTQGLRDVLTHAREEARGLGHEYIGTEHLLLALLRTTDPTGVELLRGLDVDRDAVRVMVETTVKRGHKSLPPAELPFTSRGKRTLELAMEASRELDHANVGIEHLLLGLVREGKGIGGQVLMEHGVTEARAKTAIAALRRS
jgi:ATP-dependent Clp protease ATP-binding subunit ClpC